MPLIKEGMISKEEQPLARIITKIHKASKQTMVEVVCEMKLGHSRELKQCL